MMFPGNCKQTKRYKETKDLPLICKCLFICNLSSDHFHYFCVYGCSSRYRTLNGSKCPSKTTTNFTAAMYRYLGRILFKKCTAWSKRVIIVYHRVASSAIQTLTIPQTHPNESYHVIINLWLTNKELPVIGIIKHHSFISCLKLTRPWFVTQIQLLCNVIKLYQSCKVLNYLLLLLPCYC